MNSKSRDNHSIITFWTAQWLGYCTEQRGLLWREPLWLHSWSHSYGASLRSEFWKLTVKQIMCNIQQADQDLQLL